MAHLEAADRGKPIQEALVVDVGAAADCLEYFAGVAPRALTGMQVPQRNAFAYRTREPLGICVGIGA